MVINKPPFNINLFNIFIYSILNKDYHNHNHNHKFHKNNKLFKSNQIKFNKIKYK
jgi:hypothetical protein